MEIAFRHSSAELQLEDGVITLGGNDAENQHPAITGAETLARPVLRKKVFHCHALKFFGIFRGLTWIYLFEIACPGLISVRLRSHISPSLFIRDSLPV